MSKFENERKILDIGNIRVNHNQEKIHVSQMSATDKSYLIDELQKLGNERLIVTNHLLNKVDNGITVFDKKDFAETLWNLTEDNIIEYSEVLDNYTPRLKQRALIRSSKIHEVNGMKLNMCVVVEFTTKQVITAYMNRVDDSHDTINMNRYTLPDVALIEEGGIAI